jgi:diguanylate cyclase (GGDEF)-like protein/PAS domain S-box-containing protein
MSSSSRTSRNPSLISVAPDVLRLYCADRWQLLQLIGLLALALGLGIALVAWLIPDALVDGLASYAALHTILEICALTVAFAVFSVGWIAPEPRKPLIWLVFSGAFLAIGLIDLLHLLSYQGMPDFVTPADPEKAIFFWLAARLLAALVLLGLLLWQPTQPEQPWHRPTTLIVVALLVAGCAWIGLWHYEQLPRTFIAGQGLTPFKIGFEFMIVGIHFLTLVLLVQRRRLPRPFTPEGIALVLVASLFSEICFMLYVDVTDGFNLLGHVYKVLAYVFLYRTVYVGAIHAPYRQLHQEQQALQESKALLQAFADYSQNILLMMEPAGRRLIYLSWSYADVWGRDPNEIMANPELFWESVHPDDRTMLRRVQIEPLDGHRSIEYRILRPDAEVRWIEAHLFPVYDGEGCLHLVGGIASDITVRKEIEQRLRASEERFRGLVDAMEDVIYTLDHQQRHTGVYGRWLQRMGLPAEAFLGKTACEIFGPEAALIHEDANCRALAGDYIVYDWLMPGTEPRHYQTILSPFHDVEGNITGIVGVGRDVTALKQAELLLQRQQVELSEANERLQALAITDGLTGVRNHRSFQQQLAEAVARSSRNGQPLALVLLDIDYFKNYNDCYGHPAGDQALRDLARRLQDSVRATDVVARYGGEEFALILLDSDLVGARETVERCRQAMAVHHWCCEAITASFGIAGWRAGLSPSDLIKAADEALYAAKAAGRDQAATAG